MARMLELKREPEVVFWVFVFPLLLASGAQARAGGRVLGLRVSAAAGVGARHRSPHKPSDASSVAIVAGTEAPQVQTLLQRSPRHASFKVDVQDEAAARKGFRLGKYDLVIEPDGAGGLRYRYDPARPESVLSPGGRRQCAADRGWTQRRGRNQLVTSSDPGSRYIDFLIPGLLGMN